MRKKHKIRDLVKLGIIYPPEDGNHGEIHPKSSDFKNSGVPFIMASDLRNGKVSFNSCKFISKNQADNLRKGFAQEGDILLTHKATIGETAIVPKIEYPYLMLTPQVTFYRIKDNTKLNNSYLKYYFTSQGFQKQLRLWSGAGSTRAYIGILEQLNLPIEIEEDIIKQQKIASVLSVLDSKIELNNKIDAELKQIAKSIYNYWFVQFDFPSESGKPYRNSKGKMVWNEELKRMIPKGWEVKNLEDCLETIIDYRGKTPRKLGGDWSNNPNDIIALSAKHVKDGQLVNLQDANRVDDNMYKVWMKERLDEGDILMTSEAPCGEFFYLVGKTKFCLSQRLFAIRANTDIVKHAYLYYELSLGNGNSQILGKVSGSTVFGIRQDELRTVKILIPNLNLQKVFNEIVGPIYQKIRNNEYQNQQLSALRDWLLPILMNGQVTVKN